VLKSIIRTFCHSVVVVRSTSAIIDSSFVNDERRWRQCTAFWPTREDENSYRKHNEIMRLESISYHPVLSSCEMCVRVYSPGVQRRYDHSTTTKLGKDKFLSLMRRYSMAYSSQFFFSSSPDSPQDLVGRKLSKVTRTHVWPVTKRLLLKYTVRMKGRWPAETNEVSKYWSRSVWLAEVVPGGSWAWCSAQRRRKWNGRTHGTTRGTQEHGI
jgi:hypothetical protein